MSQSSIRASVQGASFPGQTLSVVAATPINGAGLDVSRAGNVTFIVKNTIAGTVWTGAPVLVFEQSDDNVSWGPMQVVRADNNAAASTHTLTPLVASSELMLDSATEGVNWVRVRVTTAQGTAGMTVVTQPGGMAFSPLVTAALRTDGAARVQMAFGTVAAGLVAGTTATEVMTVLAQEFRAGVSINTTLSVWPITVNKTFRVTSFTVGLKANAALVSSAIYTLRYNPTGAAVITSAPAVSLALSVPAVSGQFVSQTVAIDGGIDLAGGTTPGQFGVSILPTWVTTAPTTYVWLTGYEY
jgi:hypothetical protein